MKHKPSLLIIGNSNVGKSSITRLLLPNPKHYKGKSGKTPGSTLLVKSTDLPGLSYKIIDLPGFGYMKSSSRRREEHIKKQIVLHVEKYHKEFFLGLVVINILRAEDEIDKYFIQNKETIPLSFELINFLREFKIPVLIIFNKIDKLSQFDKKKAIEMFIDSAKKFGLNIKPFNGKISESEIQYLEFSALKKINIKDLKRAIHQNLEMKKNV